MKLRYTSGRKAGMTMAHVKIAVSLPEEIYQSLEAKVSESGESRSAVVSTAIEQYLSRDERGTMTERINRVLDDLTDDEVQEEQRWTEASRNVAAARLRDSGESW